MLFSVYVISSEYMGDHQERAHTPYAHMLRWHTRAPCSTRRRTCASFRPFGPFLAFQSSASALTSVSARSLQKRSVSWPSPGVSGTSAPTACQRDTQRPHTRRGGGIGWRGGRHRDHDRATSPSSQPSAAAATKFRSSTSSGGASLAHAH